MTCRIRRSLAAAAAVAMVPAMALAQTSEDAGKFFDQTIISGIQIYRTPGTQYAPQDYNTVPNVSVTKACLSDIQGTAMNGTSGRYKSAPYFNVKIDWTSVKEVRDWGTGANNNALVLVGGATTTMNNGQGYTYESESGPQPALLILTGSPTLNARLTKAINVLIKACAKPSYGF